MSESKRNSADIRAHWTDSALKHGSDIKATTRTPTAKMLEIAALTRAISGIKGKRDTFSILEAGCGNGQNCIALAKAFPNARLAGFDYIPDMITAANALREKESVSAERISFAEGDVTDLSTISASFDFIMSVRCLINLSSVEEQLSAVTGLSKLLRPDGHMLLIENSMTTYQVQNEFRVSAGLAPRTPAHFNLFFDEERLLKHLKLLGFDVDVRDFSSLHDLVLYVLVPMINGGTIDYDHPMVDAATRLCIQLGDKSESLGHLGQNRFFVCRKL